MTKDFQPGPSLFKFHYLLNAVARGLSFITGTSMGQSWKPQNLIWVRSYDTSYAWPTSRNKIIYSSFHVVTCINDIILDFAEFCCAYCCVFFIHLLHWWTIPIYCHQCCNYHESTAVFWHGCTDTRSWTFLERIMLLCFKDTSILVSSCKACQA